MKSLLVVIILFCLIFIGEFKAYSNEFQKNEYSINLPDGWIEIPKDIIESNTNEMSKKVPNIARPYYDSGFQLAENQNWFEFPYVFIAFDNKGRVPEREIKKIEDKFNQKLLDKVNNNLNPLISNLQNGEMFYEKQANIIWMRMSSDVPDKGKMVTLTAMIPTEKGFIEIYCYSSEDSFLDYESIFKSIVMSVKLAPKLVYKPNWTDNLPTGVAGINWENVLVKAIAGAIIGGIITFIGVLSKKNKK